jgi:repressor LexA
LRIFLREYGRMSSYQEIADIFHFASKNASFYLIKKLIKEGIIDKDQKGKLIPRRLNLPLPYLGAVKAGLPAPQEGQVADMISLDEYLIDNPDSSFLLKVSGDSMINAGINEGDIVVVEKIKEPKNDDIVAASVDGECTLKYFRKSKDGVVLIAANENYKDIYPKNDFYIYGKVVSLIRKY